MATEVLAIGTGLASSSDITVAAGSTVTLCLKDAAGPEIFSGRVMVQIKADSAEYFNIDELNTSQVAVVIVGAGTYRVQRIAESPSCGVFSG
jgi:hypothetical protein